MKKDKRNSSIEILRIISMLMIIAHHYFVHGGFGDTTLENVSISRVFLSVISIYGKSACGIFALITGYVSVSKKTTLKSQVRKSILIMLEMIFYSLISLAIYYLICGADNISTKDIIDSFLPVHRGNWYARNYVYFCLFIPFINIFISSLDKKSYSSLIILILVTWIAFSFIRSNAMSVGEMGMMLFMYLIGSYIKLYKEDFSNYKNVVNLYLALLFASLLAISVVLFNYIGYVINSSYLVERYDFFIEWNSILSFGLSYYLFVYFSNKEFYSKAINTVSSSCLGIYLLHDNDFIRELIWKRIYPNYLYANNPYFHSIVKVIVVFIICCIIDILRRNTLEKLLNKIMDKYYDPFYQKVCRLFNNI